MEISRLERPLATGAGQAVRERIAAVLQQIGRRDGTLRAFAEVDAEGALRRAETLDRLPPEARGPLHGLPVAVKEVIDVAGRLCAWGSRLHAGRRPAGDAAVVQRLLQAGAVVIGITASTEYALAARAPTVHPLDPVRSPGASSSGSAAAVGAGLVPVALGTQTIGSIIRPAAYCGVVGFKPTLGRYPPGGVLCLSDRLDAPGLLADAAARVAAVDAVLAGPAAGAPSGLCRIAPWFDEPMSDGVQAVLEAFHARLAGQPLPLRTARVDSDIAADEADVMDVVLTAELAWRHGAVLAAHPEAVSDKLAEMVRRGREVSDARRAWAWARQAHIAQRLDAMLRPGEIALVPATIGTAPRLEAGTGSRAPQRLWTLAGMPALTLPVGRADGLPVGVQLVARRGEDGALLQAACRLERLARDAAHA